LRTTRYDERGLKGRKSLKGKRGGAIGAPFFAYYLRICALLAQGKGLRELRSIKGTKEVVKGYKA
jgi:hypothetical protein